MGKKKCLFSKNGKGARTNEICQSFIMNAEVNSLSPWKYLEWLLAEIKELEEPIEEGGCYLPWSEEAQEYLYLKISTLLQKRSLNAIRFEKIIAYQAIWRTFIVLSLGHFTLHQCTIRYLLYTF